MCVTGKMIPVETAPGMEDDGGGEFKDDIFDTL
jgi:hypothetical protein